FLQEEEFERVGGTKTIKVDVRIISATNKDLDEMVREETFREDLYYRLKVVTVDVPPLRERREDIPLIVDYQLKRFIEIHNKIVKGISPEAMEVINSYNWPGNIRELMNCIESAVVMTREDHINVESLPPFLFLSQEKQRTTGKVSKNLFDIERDTILETLNRTGGNKAKAAKELGFGLRTLYRKIEQYGMKQ
ncbi:MAG: sigma 54-interacting transcriptional regulator, partial [Candidatus Mariimomonas ferrooxydans]